MLNSKHGCTRTIGEGNMPRPYCSTVQAKDIRARAHNELMDALIAKNPNLRKCDGNHPGDNEAWDKAVGGNFVDYTNGWAERAVMEAAKRTEQSSNLDDDSCDGPAYKAFKVWHDASKSGGSFDAFFGGWAARRDTEQSECSSPITDEMIAAGAAAIHKPHGWYNSRLGTDVSCPGGNVYVGCNEIAEIRRTAYTVLKAALGTVQALDEARRFKVVVNATEHTVDGSTISYDDVVTLAGRRGAKHLTVTYCQPSGNTGGSLIPGEFISLRDGLIFCATNTSNA